MESIVNYGNNKKKQILVFEAFGDWNKFLLRNMGLMDIKKYMCYTEGYII